MNELIFEVRIGFYHFHFKTAEEAVSFAIAAKLNNVDRTDNVSIEFIENLNPLENETNEM